ncbi:MAG: hypothetical protein JWN86_731 [Planctomycetota bacterium]|nr:hypothetical protein [Planctomycetota bacterium]
MTKREVFDGLSKLFDKTSKEAGDNAYAQVYARPVLDGIFAITSHLYSEPNDFDAPDAPTVLLTGESPLARVLADLPPGVKVTIEKAS